MKASSLSTRVLSLAALLSLAAIILLSPVGARGSTGAQATFCVGFILLFGYYLARLLGGLALPAITSYILVGLFCGPSGLNLLSVDVIAGLQRLEDVALALIALIAGGEMRLAVLRARTTAFASVIGMQIMFSMLGAGILVFVFRDHLGAVPADRARDLVAVALLFGLVIVARSPATTIGVVAETRSKGPLTEVIVGVTVLLDVIILALAALIVPTAETLIEGRSFSLEFAGHLAFEIAGSVGVGILFGLLMGVYIRLVRGYLPLFLLGVGVIGSELCRIYGLSPLLAFMIAGFFVENFSRHGPRLIAGLERSAFPVYVIFFAISGASIDVSALRTTWLIAFALVAVRIGAFFFGSLTAARAVPDIRPYGRNMWTGFLAQAGVTIGIASIVAERFAWGREIETIVLSAVALNQLAGPVALKWLLEKSGEAGGMDRGG